MGIRRYGVSDDEQTLKESLESKDIVKAIMDHGVSQRQIMFILHDLTMQLENNDHIKRITSLLEEIAEEKSNLII